MFVEEAVIMGLPLSLGFYFRKLKRPLLCNYYYNYNYN